MYAYMVMKYLHQNAVIFEVIIAVNI